MACVAVGLHQLRYFVTVTDMAQVSAAARVLHIAQPALSQSLRSLERDLGVTLLVRHTRGVTPTAAGERFLQHARVAIRAADDAVEAARSANGGRVNLTLGAASAPMVSALIAGFRSACPDVTVTWHELTFLTEMRAARDGDVDISFVLVPYGEPTLELEGLWTMPPALYCGWDHPLARRGSVRFEDVAEETMPAQHPAVPDEFADHFYLTARRGYRPRTSANPPSTVNEAFALIASGQAIAISPIGITPPPDMPAAAAVVPMLDVPPFELSMLYRTRNDEPGLGAFLAHARGLRRALRTDA
jgi:DNA-binding transcriptional LysR family regulator